VQKSNSHYAPQPYTNQSVFKSLLNCSKPPLKLRPYGGIEMCVLLLLASCLINAKPLSGTPPCRKQVLDWLHKPWPNRWLVASQ